jgi:hypothetical protein
VAILQFGGVAPVYRIPTIGEELTRLNAVAFLMDDNRIPSDVQVVLYMSDGEFGTKNGSGIGRRSYDGEVAAVGIRVGLELSGKHGAELREALAELYVAGAHSLVPFMRKKRPEIDLSQFPDAVKDIMKAYVVSPPAYHDPDDHAEMEIFAQYFRETGKLHPLAIQKNKEAKDRRPNPKS